MVQTMQQHWHPDAEGVRPRKQGSASEGKPKKGLRRHWTVIITILAIGLAAFLLYHTLSRYSFDELVASVTGIPLSRLAAAGAFAAASYLCLTGFDYLALHYVRKPLPYYKAALASFTSLSLGHNIGLAALSSGAVRYRFYSRWGLGAEEIAKIILFCGVTVGLGLMTLGGVTLLLQTELATSVTGLGRPMVMWLGEICLGLVATYLVLAAVLRKPLRIRKWSFEMPPLRLAAGQIVIGSLNFACVAACLHQVILAVADVPYFATASVYVIANTSVLITHVPGGLGVIEGVVQYLLPQADLIGPLLAFRFVYFLVPLALGGTLFLITELVLRRRT